jgi:glutathione S-transferase
MIELYKLHWSHYVEKVRWALDFKQLPWRGIEVVAFIKKELQRFDCAPTFPLIHDTATGVAISDSSPIIRYLDETYPARPLLPADPALREETWQWMLRLDSTLGLHGRRLGYTQVIMECPDTLAQLFMANVAGGMFTRRGLRRPASAVLGAMLTLRFRFHRNRQDRVYEKLEAQLLWIAGKIEREGYLVGGAFSAADITLASLLRPLRVVPHFSHHPRLQQLFAWQGRLFQEHGRDDAYPYEDAIRVQRERSGRMRGRVRWMRPGPDRMDVQTGNDEPLQEARNDIHELSRWRLPLGLPAYLRLRWFSGIGRVRYTPPAFLAQA